MSDTLVNLARRRRRVALTRTGLWLLLIALLGTSAAVPLFAVRRYREVIRYAYSAAPRPTPASRTPGPASTPPAGALVVRSDPERCATYLDGRYVGHTPLRVDGLAFGLHRLELKRFPFEAARRTVELKRNVQEIAIELRQRTGQVQLLGPADAAVSVDGEPLGVLPHGPIELPVGPHQFQVVGAVAWLKTIEIVESQRLTYDVTTIGSLIGDPPPQEMTAQATAATLLVNASPWGEVELDGQRLGFSPMLLTNLEPGTHALSVARRGFVTERRLVHLRPAQRASVHLRLRRED
jgi:hypothetical protein